MTAHDNDGSPGHDTPPTDITDIAQLQEQIAQLLERINADGRLAMAAAVNPLLALEELGYRLAPAVRREIERRSRYTKRQLARLEALRKAFLEAAPGYPVEDLDVLSSAQVRRLLRETLQIPDDRISRDLDLPPRPAPDPLACLQDAHPAVPALLGLRDIERSALRFAPPERYREVRKGKLTFPVRAVSGKVAGRTPSPERTDHG